MSLFSVKIDKMPTMNLVTGADLWYDETSTIYSQNWHSQVPLKIFEDGVAMTERDGSDYENLQPGEWAYNDNYGDLYVRLSDDTDPDTKPWGYLQALYPYLVLTNSNYDNMLLLSIIISNTSDENSELVFYVTDENDNIRFSFLMQIDKAQSFEKWTDKIFLEKGEKLWAVALNGGFSIAITGDRK